MRSLSLPHHLRSAVRHVPTSSSSIYTGPCASPIPYTIRTLEHLKHGRSSNPLTHQRTYLPLDVSFQSTKTWYLHLPAHNQRLRWLRGFRERRPRRAGTAALDIHIRPEEGYSSAQQSNSDEQQKKGVISIRLDRCMDLAQRVRFYGFPNGPDTSI